MLWTRQYNVHCPFTFSRPRRVKRSSRLFAREDVERQIAIVAVVAVKEASFLHTMDRIIGGIEIQDDLRRGGRVRLHEHVDEQAIHGVVIDGDLLVARLLANGRAGQLEAIQRALAGAWRREIAGFREDRDERIVAQRVVIVQVFVAEREAVDPLPHQRRHRMRHPRRIAMIGEAGRELAQQIRRPIHLAAGDP